MAILIDPPAWPAHRTLWSHLISDADYEELHRFAARLGVPRRGFDLDHYDVPASMFERAVALGARPVTAKEVVHGLRISGLRVPQRDRARVTPVRRRQYLESEWLTLGAQLDLPGVPAGSASGDVTAQWQHLGETLLGHWSEAHRSYHTELHLEEVLLGIDQLGVRGDTVTADTLLAAWFHDAIYTGTPVSDEQQSAELAVTSLRLLGVQDALVARVAEIVLATIPGAGQTEHSQATAQLLDADLSIFAASPARYDAYRRAVRSEYAHVPESTFRAARADVLRRYLARPTIYHGETARTLWEERARANVGAEFRELTELPPAPRPPTRHADM